MDSYEERQAQIVRLKEENQDLLSTPLMSEGNISSMQVGMFSERQKKKWQDNVIAKMALQSKIRWLNQTDDEIRRFEQERVDKKISERRNQIQSRLDLINGLGSMSHKKNGKLRDCFAREVEELKRELAN